MTLEQAFGLYNYWVVVILMMTGFYMVIARRNFVKSILGLNIFQTSVFLLYITMGKIHGATTPIVPPEVAAAQTHHAQADHGHDATQAENAHESALHEVPHDAGEHSDSILSALQPIDLSYTGMKGISADEIVYSHPLPSVLMLTAIVVGVATTSLALALIVRIREEYGTIEEDEIMELDRAE